MTRPRLERSLPTSFANLYADQACLEGRTGVAPASLHAPAMCDKAGRRHRLRSRWRLVCLMSWNSNECYTEAGPSELTGFLTVTDAAGKSITKPVFEVTCGSGSDGCAGTIAATAGDTPLGTTTYDVAEESTATLALPDPVPSGATTVSFSMRSTTGVGPSSPVSLPVQ